MAVIAERTGLSGETLYRTLSDKGNQWYFGMKAHIGVDAEGGLVHTVTTTPANAGDVTEAAKLLHGKETLAFGDAGYTGVEKREEIIQDKAKRKVTWYVAEKRDGK